MNKLRRVQTQDREVNQLQSNVAEVLDPIAALPVINGNILTNVALLAGDNSINHKLGMRLTGWIVIRQRAAAEIFDKQVTNPTPTVTLVLNVSAPVVVDLYVF